MLRMGSARAMQPERKDLGRYDAFISYRHVEPDRAWAHWLHRALETYRVPAIVVREAGVPDRIRRVFRDEEELEASADLSASIDEALRQARWLIVVCSPRTPVSRWVGEEIERFRQLGRSGQILALLIEGEPADSFRQALRDLPGGRAGTLEPLAADVRPNGVDSPRSLRTMAKLRLLAALLGCRFDDLRRRHQERAFRTLVRAGTAMAGLVVGMACLTLFAVSQWRSATERLGRLSLDQGALLCERGNIPAGLLWFAQGLESANRDTPAEQALRMNLGLWGRRLTDLRPALRHGGAVHVAVFHPRDTRWLLTAGDDRTARLWDTDGGTMAWLVRHDEPVVAAAFEPDGRRIITATGRKVQHWDSETGRPLGAPLSLPDGTRSVWINPDGRTLLSAHAGLTGQLWDLERAERIGPALRHQDWGITVAVFSRDGRLLLTGSGDRTTRVWDAHTGTPLGAPMPSPWPVQGLAISPDGRRALVGSGAGLLKKGGQGQLWDLDVRQPIGSALVHDELVTAVAFSPDGRLAVTGGYDKVVRVWETATGRPAAPPLVHVLAVVGVRFHPDGRWLLTWDYGSSARLWNAVTGKPMGPPLAHDDPILAANFSSDGRLLATAADGRRFDVERRGDARIWEVTPLTARLRDIVAWAEVLARGRLDRDGTLRLMGTQEWERRRRQLLAGDSGLILPPDTAQP